LPVAEALRRCQDDHPGDVTMLTVFMGGEDAASLLAGEDGARTIPHYQFPEQAALALTRAVDYGDWQRRDHGTVPQPDAVDGVGTRDIVDPALGRLGADGSWLEPEEVMGLLKTGGLRMPLTKAATTEDEAVAIATEIGRSVLKVIS